MKTATLFSALLLMAILAGCGGGGGDGTSLTLTSEPALDGSISPGDPFGLTGGYTTTEAEDYIGDTAASGSRKIFLSFDISGIPVGSTIESAVLRVYQSSYNNGGYNLGAALVDHIYFGSTVTQSILDMPALSTISDSLATDYLEGWKQLDVTSALQNDVDNTRSYSQYRMYHLGSNDDGEYDQDGWLLGDSAINKPELVVTYH